MLRILLADDSEVIRRVIGNVLSAEPDMHIVGEVSDGLEAVRKADELQPDIVLLDVRMPTLSGFQAAEKIRDVAPCAEIIFLTQYASRWFVTDAQRLGASAYVVKGSASTDLVLAIRSTQEHGDFFSSLAS